MSGRMCGTGYTGRDGGIPRVVQECIYPGMYIGRHTTLGGIPASHHPRRHTLLPPPGYIQHGYTTRVHTARIHPPGYTGRYTPTRVHREVHTRVVQNVTYPGGTERYIPGCGNGAHTRVWERCTYPGVSEECYLPGCVGRVLPTRVGEKRAYTRVGEKRAYTRVYERFMRDLHRFIPSL